jgi:hypothetical protein
MTEVSAPSPGACERIVRAAIKTEREIYHLAPPARHHTVMLEFDLGLKLHDQGFLTSEGRYVDRLEGMRIAKAAGQLKRREGPQYYQGPELFSEDLW